MRLKKFKITLDKLVLLCMATTIIVATISLSKFKTTIATASNAKAAVPVIDLSSTSLNISIAPLEEKTYTFSVANNKDGQKSETAMEYTLQIKTLSNLPLEFELYTYDNSEIGENNLLSGNGNITDKIPMNIEENVSHTYQLKIKWKTDEIDYRYSQVADYVQIVLNSSQVD